MAANIMNSADLKRKIRNLKQLEIKIRSSNNYFGTCNIKSFNQDTAKLNLVWDEFFDLHDGSSKKAKYTISRLAAMSKDELKNVISEYFFFVYYRFYKDNNMVNISIYDPEILSQLGLPINADSNDIKKRFHELAKLYHPDNGGDNSRFIDLMEKFESLK